MVFCRICRRHINKKNKEVPFSVFQVGEQRYYACFEHMNTPVWAEFEKQIIKDHKERKKDELGTGK